MTPIAPHISAFLREYLPGQKSASQHTCDTYAYGFQLLFEYVSSRLMVKPSDLMLEQIEAGLVMDFLAHLEEERGNSPATRNARLAAIKAFMRFVEHRVPSCLDQCRRVLAIPVKKTDTHVVQYLTPAEVQAILDVPDLTTRAGVRDRAMLHLCFAAGLRVSELIALPVDALDLQVPSVRIMGKGRKQRILPLWKQTAADLRAWLALRGTPACTELFVNARGGPLSRSGCEYILRKHADEAVTHCSSLAGKRISPHVLRHSCAMMVLQATGDVRKVSLWLGHANMQTTEVYLRADPTEKLEAMDEVVPPELRRGRFRAPDKLIASLLGR